MNQIVLNGNNIDLLKNYPDNHFDAVVTDPPYGLGKEPNAEALMKDWIDKGYHEVGGTGFMGKEWDAFVPQPIFWKEVFRVLKHGGHVVSFFGSRTYDWGVMAMRFANFEVRDTITWHFGSGFPKSHNIGKAIDKLYGAEREIIGTKERGSVEEAKERGVGFLSDPANRNNTKQFGYGTELITSPSTEDAKQWDGWGSALKPASEYIVLARKPLEKGLSIAENVLKWGTGGINIDGCRVGNEQLSYTSTFNRIIDKNVNIGYRPETTRNSGNEIKQNVQGRFPANLILTHHSECECKGLKKVKGTSGYETDGENSETKFGQIKTNKITTHYGSEETIEDWNCHEDCPIRIMDEQSGVSKVSSGGKTFHGEKYDSRGIDKNCFGDKGGASRFFYCAKASKSERNKGLELKKYILKDDTPIEIIEQIKGLLNL
jgi:site-specific DNA-methyltransferase (adenine-specific)